MNRIAFPLKLQMKSPEVAHLHEALVFLGLTITEAETTNQRYGATTRAAVLQLQTTHNLPASGAVTRRPLTPSTVCSPRKARSTRISLMFPARISPISPVVRSQRVAEFLARYCTSMALRSGECRSRHSIAAWVANSH